MEHYKETFQNIKDFWKLRDRLFLWALVLIGLQFFQISSPGKSSKFITDLVKEHLGFQILANVELLNTLLWFILLSTTIRYFQTNVYINRQYDYIGGLEKKFTIFFGGEIICREGVGYLKNYPWFSNWIDFLYTWVFPILLVLIGGFKIYKEFPGYENIGQWSYFFNIAFYLFISISTFLYLIFLKGGTKEKS